jgi:hypothetical protein
MLKRHETIQHVSCLCGYCALDNFSSLSLLRLSSLIQIDVEPDG